MTTKVRITHAGGSHAVEVILDGTLVTLLEKEGDAFEDNVYGGRKFVVREHHTIADDERAPSHNPDVPADNGPKE